MQGRNGDADVENGLVDTARGGEGDEWRKEHWYATVCKTDSWWECAV